MDTTSSAIFDICKNINSYPQCFYGMFSRIAFELTMDYTLRVSIAPILEEMKGKTGGKIAPGTKMYDDNKKAVFTLNHDDMMHIARHWKEIRTNTYVNNDPKCKDEFKNKFTLVHYGDNNTYSNFSLTSKTNEIDKLVVSIKGQDGNSASFQLSNDINRCVYNLNHFENLINNVSKNAIYDKLSFQSIIKSLNSALYKLNNNNNNNNNYQNNRNNNYQNNRNNNYQNNRNNNYQNNQPNQSNNTQQVNVPTQPVQSSPVANSDEFESFINNSFNDMVS